MSIYTQEQLDVMDNKEVVRLGKKHGISTSKLSPFQIKQKLLEVTEASITQENTVMATKKAKKVEKKSKVKVERKPRTGTKAEKCREIFEANKGAERKDVLAKFVKIGLSKAGASTYYQNIKKEQSK